MVVFRNVIGEDLAATPVENIDPVQAICFGNPDKPGACEHAGAVQPGNQPCVVPQPVSKHLFDLVGCQDRVHRSLMNSLDEGERLFVHNVGQLAAALVQLPVCGDDHEGAHGHCGGNEVAGLNIEGELHRLFPGVNVQVFAVSCRGRSGGTTLQGRPGRATRAPLRIGELQRDGVVRVREECVV